MKPNRFLTWDNSLYSHILIPGQELREMVGPLTFKDAAAHMTSVAVASDSVFQAYAAPLVVKPGGFLKIHAQFVLFKWPQINKGADVDEFEIYCANFAGAAPVNGNGKSKFTRGSVFPNTWKVSQRHQDGGGKQCKGDAGLILFSFSFPYYPHI